MCSAHSLSMSSLLLTWLCFVTSVFVRGSDREYEDFERCSAPRSEPCGASGHMTMKGWQLTGKPVEEVCSHLSIARDRGVFFHFSAGSWAGHGSGYTWAIVPSYQPFWWDCLAHEPTMIQLKEARSRRWPTITVRHPMERLQGSFCNGGVYNEYVVSDFGWRSIRSLRHDAATMDPLVWTSSTTQ